MKKTPARQYAKGIGEAVADRTVNRQLVIDKKGNAVPFAFDKNKPGTFDEQIKAFADQNGHKIRRETWEEVAHRVALGSAMLHPEEATREHEYNALNHHMRQASVLMSGRHLQHGDESQVSRNMEVFTNCSTAATTFLSFYLLLNGSGVGRCYDDKMMAVDFAGKMPYVQVFIAPDHKDVLSGEISRDFTAVREWPGEEDGKVVYYSVPDSREGWAQAVEKLEVMTFEGSHHDTLLVLDFSDVRPRGTPIGGMQNRPASGPGPLMTAIDKIAALRGSGMAPWKAAMHADHYMAECVLVGGARRAARMATKDWRDPTTVEFVNIKKGGVLWSSNNSVTVDQEFWDHVRNARDGVHSHDPYVDDAQTHAYNVYKAIVTASYFDKTGEPGLINVDKLTWKDEETDTLFDDGEFAESDRMKLQGDSISLMRDLVTRWKTLKYKVITNPCGEIVLNLLGGYCVIADVVPFHSKPQPLVFFQASGKSVPVTDLAAWDDDAEDAFRAATRALVRTNLMNSLYGKEVKRTNRIGVGITGLHEYAWERFGFGWHDILDEQKSQPFWMMLSRFSNAVVDEAAKYSAKLGVKMPHTALTMKPAGTTSKLFGLTEGAHLPSMLEYMRWVQFRNDDPLIKEYERHGYPTRKLVQYEGTTIVGFPTAPTICTLGMGNKLVTAAEATPEEQYKYLLLLEKYWLHGYKVEIRGGDRCVEKHSFANQVSYTLKYDPKEVDFDHFQRTLLEGQSLVKCCSVMPQDDATAYEYQPEQPMTKHDFEVISAAIAAASKRKKHITEDIGIEHVDCGTGGCPIDFSEE